MYKQVVKAAQPPKPKPKPPSPRPPWPPAEPPRPVPLHGGDFYGDYAVDANGNVMFDADGKHYMIPKDKVLTGRKPTGRAVWWWADSVYPEDGKITYCFALGPEGLFK